MYAGKPLAEIAGYDDYQINRVLCLPRNKHGRLIRNNDGLPAWVKTDDQGMRIVTKRMHFGTMFKKVKQWQGNSPAKANRAWEEFTQKHPRLVRSHG